MSIRSIFFALWAAISLAGCSNLEQVSRSLAGTDATAPTPVVAQQSLSVQDIVVHVPRSLSVSDANAYFPNADIVWQEEARGDRYNQVQSIFETALQNGVAGLPDGNRPARLEVQITKFHTLTRKARYSVGGVHAVQFFMVLSDPTTGAHLTEPRLIKADFKALGGWEANAAEAQGETQKSRIIAHLASVIRAELSQPGSYSQQKLGLIGALNQL